MIALTGGAGFIGSCFLWKLNLEGLEDIIVVDSMDEKNKEPNFKSKKFKDFIDKTEFLKLVEKNKLPKLSHIIHMGACSSTTETNENYLIKNNYEYSKSLAEYAFKNNIPFMYASSAATYGDGSQGYDDKDSNAPNLKPLNLYGRSKQMFDLWILENKHTDKATGLKFFNVFGPNEYHKGEMKSVICKRFDDVNSGLPMKLFKSYHKEYKDGEQKRDFIYIKDAVEVMYYLYKNPSKTGIFNLGTGKARSWNDIANAMFKALDKQPKIEYIEMPDNLKDKYQYFTEAKMDKLRSTGYKTPFRSLEDSIKDYTNYLKNKSYL
ncbi:ADP-glyceromanno-heptose 6-epimerase [Elusimicrobiota bacterium]